MDIANSQEKPLSREQGARYQAIYSTYPTVRICRNLLIQYIFERPIKGADNLDGMLWEQLGTDIFDQVMAYGIAIVRATPGATPCIVPWDMCRVTIALDSKFNKVLRVYPSRIDHGPPDVPMTHVYALDVFGFSPSLNGELNSLMRPLLYSVELVRDQMDCTMVADRARARPPCFAETHADATAPAQEVTYDYYADATSVQQSSMNTYMRNQSAMEQLEAQQDNLRTRPVAGDTGREQLASHNVNVAVKNAIDSIVPMPIGQQVARGPECSAPDQLVDRLRFIEQEIFVLLGVPRSFCMHDITVRHDAGMLHCTLTRTIQKWQKGISTALSFVYNVCHNGPPKKRKRMDVEKTARERNTTLYFELMPRVSVPELSYVYDKGIVKWESYQRMISTFCGISPDDLTTGGDPWTKEDRMESLAGKSALKSEFKKENTGAGL